MYQDMIRETLARLGRIGVEPRHVEAWMRSAHGTLDALAARQWKRAVEDAVACVDEADASEPGLNERVAQSYAL